MLLLGIELLNFRFHHPQVGIMQPNILGGKYKYADEIRRSREGDTSGLMEHYRFVRSG